VRHPFITAVAAAGASYHPHRTQQATGAGRHPRPPGPAAAGLDRRDAAGRALRPAAGRRRPRPPEGRAGQAVERTLAREHHATPAPAGQAVKAAQRTLAREHHTVPAPADRKAAGAQPAAPSRTRPLLVVVGAASLIVVLTAAATFLRLRARPQAAT
jgi:hypothetical protein